MGEIARFILFIGPCSSIFDYTTYLMMLYIFGCWDTPARAHASLFQTGWFVESLLTQTLIIHIIRTNRIPFLQSRASWPLIVTVRDHYCRRHVAALFADRPVPGLHAAAGTLLAPAGTDAVQLRRAHAGGEDVADPQEVDLR